MSGKSLDLNKIVAQPVTWGINYLPDWGVMLPADSIFRDMKTLGINATEYQPGLFPEDPAAANALFSARNIKAVAGWIDVQVHNENLDQLASEFEKRVKFLKELGIKIATLGARSERIDFDQKVKLSSDEWKKFYEGIKVITGIADDNGIEIALHTHVGTAVEDPESIKRTIENTDIGFCYDTGHIACGGGDPLEIASLMGSRIKHVHLKDVDLPLVNKLIAGEITWPDAVGKDIFLPLGDGDVKMDKVLDILDENHYDGWLVIEQDIRLFSEKDRDVPMNNMLKSLSFLETWGN